MTQDTQITKVVFRKFKEGDVIALFPEIPAKLDGGWLCWSYMHIGQHGAANPGAWLINETTPATPAEYADLKAELEDIGYRLQVCTRIARNAYAVRKQTLKEWLAVKS